MNPKLKAIVSQLQIALAGLIIGAFGLFWQNWLLAGFGGIVLAYGLIRFFLLNRLANLQDLPEDLTQEGVRSELDRLLDGDDEDDDWD